MQSWQLDPEYRPSVLADSQTLQKRYIFVHMVEVVGYKRRQEARHTGLQHPLAECFYFTGVGIRPEITRGPALR